MSTIFVTIGAPLCGKSTWRNDFLKTHPNTLVVCPDDIRKELTGSISDQSRNAEVFQTAYNRLQHAISIQVNRIIFDGTNIRPQTRDEIFDIAGQNPVHYVIFDVPLDELKRRKIADAERIKAGERSDVPDDVIERFYNQLKDNMQNIIYDERATSVGIQ